MKKIIILILIAAGALALALFGASYLTYLTLEHRVSRQFQEQEQQLRIARKTQELTESRIQMTKDVMAFSSSNPSEGPALDEKIKSDYARVEKLEKELKQLGGTDPDELARKEWLADQNKGGKTK